MELDKIKGALHYLFLFVTLLLFLSGLGITEYTLVEPITGGLLTKALSFQIHTWLTWPFFILLVLHVYLVLTLRKGDKKK